MEKVILEAVRVRRSHNKKTSKENIETRQISETHIEQGKEIHSVSQKLREEYISVRLELQRAPKLNRDAPRKRVIITARLWELHKVPN